MASPLLEAVLLPTESKSLLMSARILRVNMIFSMVMFVTAGRLLPKGTRIVCTAVFDNSDENPANPDPTATVRWGEQSWEEMMIGFFATVPAEETP